MTTTLPPIAAATSDGGTLRGHLITGSDSPPRFLEPSLSFWANNVADIFRDAFASHLTPRALPSDARSSARSLSTVAFEPVAGQSSSAGTKRARESSGLADFTTEASKKRHIEYSTGSEDDDSSALRQWVDERESTVESCRQSLELTGADHVRMNASTENDVSLYVKLRRLFDMGESREKRRETLHQINQLLGTGARLPQENRSDPVLNAQLLHSIKIADVPLATLLWRVGTGSGTPALDVFDRDRALVTLFGSDGDVNSQLALATMLIETGCPVDGRCADGSTPLIIAARRGNLSAVKLLLDAGVNTRLRDVRGRTALIWAAGLGHADVVKLLLNTQPDVNDRARSGITALLAAVGSGHEAVVRLLLNGNADVHLKYGDGDTVLTYATLKGHIAIVRLLQDAEAQSWRNLTDQAFASQRHD